MTVKELKEKLELLLDRLQRNKAGIPLSELKTKYKKGYDGLCQEISTLTSQYVIQTAFCGLRVRKDLSPEAISLVSQAILESGIKHKISAAVFTNQDIAELDCLAAQLRSMATMALEPLYARNTGLFLTGSCLEDPLCRPLLYNDASGQILVNDEWLPIEDFLKSQKIEEKNSSI